MITLGLRYKAKITGFEGMAVATIDYIDRQELYVILRSTVYAYGMESIDRQFPALWLEPIGDDKVTPNKPSSVAEQDADNKQ